MVLGVAVCGVLGAAGPSIASAAPPEFVPAGAFPFTSTVAVSTFETSKTKVVVRCASGTNAGETTGPNTLFVTIKLVGCEHEGVPCNSPNGVPGEIQYVRLTGTLGYIKKATPKNPTPVVGVDLSSPAGALLTSFSCGAALSVNVRGSMIGRITPVNKVVPVKSHFTLRFTEGKGHQMPAHFEGGPVDIPEASVNGGPIEAAGLSATDLLSFAVPLEIKA
jgi:hypothetical protein